MKSNFKTFLFLSVLTILFIIAGGLIGGTQGAIIAFILALAMNLFSYWFSDKIVLKRYSAREVTKNDNSRLYQIVEKLAASADLPMLLLQEEIQSMLQLQQLREFFKYSAMMNWKV